MAIWQEVEVCDGRRRQQPEVRERHAVGEVAEVEHEVEPAVLRVVDHAGVERGRVSEGGRTRPDAPSLTGGP